MRRKIYIENMPREEALHKFIRALEQKNYFEVDSEEVDLLSSYGRITSQAVYAFRSSPHYVASAMDGIAVKASDTFAANEANPITLKIEKDYIEIDTGDYVPRQFDAVVMIEDVNFSGSDAQIIKPAIPWQHIRSVGEDMVAYDMIAPIYTRIGPYELASFRSAGIEKIAVVKKPKVAIIPTGSELEESASDDMEAGKIVESNSFMLSAYCQEWGAIPLRHDIVVDDPDLLRQAVLETKDSADIIIVCSGSSAGREDYTSAIIEEFGEVLIHGVAIRPGKPAILGIIDGKPVVGVPGYPIAAQLIFQLFACPVIFRKQGLTAPDADIAEAYVSRKIASHMGVDEYIYVNLARINDRYLAYPLSRGAGISSVLVKADGIICIERGNEGLQAGESCTVSLLRPRQQIEHSLITIGSHDMTIDILANVLQKQHGIRLVSAHVGSMGGLMSLRRQETHFAGIHLLDAETGNYNQSYLERYLPDQKWILLNLVKRQQGLIIKKDNPLQISGLLDLLRDGVRYINRQRGAGTRILFDYLLAQAGIYKTAINGYDREEFTHLAVAAAVKNDACDAGMGIYASARALDLGFIPLCEERYDLCILPDLIGEETMDLLLSTINSPEFRQQVNDFGGYNLENSGLVIHDNN